MKPRFLLITELLNHFYGLLQKQKQLATKIILHKLAHLRFNLILRLSRIEVDGLIEGCHY